MNTLTKNLINLLLILYSILVFGAASKLIYILITEPERFDYGMYL